MPDAPKPKTPPKGPKGGGPVAVLKKKVGPAPVWVWAAVLIGAYLLYAHYKGGSGAASPGSTTATDASGNPIDTGTGGGGSAGGGGSPADNLAGQDLTTTNDLLSQLISGQQSQFAWDQMRGGGLDTQQFSTPTFAQGPGLDQGGNPVFDNSATAGGQQQPGGGHQATAQSSSPAVGFTSVGSSAAFTSTGGANPAAVANPNLTNKQVAAATPIVAYAQTIGVNVAQASNIKQLANGGVTYVAANGNTIEKVPGKAAYVIKAAPKPVSKQAR